MDLKDKVTIVTGGASGIGAASARKFAARGAKVVVTDVNGEGAKAIAYEIGGHAVVCDIGDEAAVNELVEEAEAAFGPVEIFFINAGIYMPFWPVWLESRGMGPVEIGLLFAVGRFARVISSPVIRMTAEDACGAPQLLVACPTGAHKCCYTHSLSHSPLTG